MPLQVYRIVAALSLPAATDLVYDPSHPDCPFTAQVHLPPDAVDLARLVETGVLELRQADSSAPPPARPSLRLLR